MLNFEEIKELIQLVTDTKMREVKIEKDEFRLVVRSEHYQQEGAMAPPAVNVVPVQPQQAIMQAAPIQPVHVAAPVEAPVANNGQSATPETPAQTNDNYITIKSPMIGTFYRSPSPDKPPFLKVGDAIEVGTVICIVEAMKLFNEIESEVSGTIIKVLADDASPVEYDSPLYLVDPS